MSNCYKILALWEFSLDINIVSLTLYIKQPPKVTLGGCIVERVNETILISQESLHKV